MQMPQVTRCEISECAYNCDNLCHALAITIGDGENPHCDTFCHANMKGGDMQTTAGVGACKVSSCVHNQSLECTCQDITVGHHGSEIDCMNFKQR